MGGVSNAARVRSRIAAFALVLGALGTGSCLVYDPSDLTGQPGGGNGGSSMSGRGGTGGGTGLTGSGGGGTTNGGAGLGGTGADSGNGSAGSTGGDGGDGGEVTGGTGGTGGAGSGGGGTPTRPELIDDCEDNNQNIRQVDGRNGLWFTDKSKGTVVPAAGAIRMADIPSGEPLEIPEMTSANVRAFRFTVTGLGTEPTADGIYALAGIDMRARTPNKHAYDASAYKGVRFYAKATEAMLPLSVQFPIAATEEGVGDCVSGAAVNDCYDHFHSIDPVPLATTWARYEVLFADTAQYGWGMNGIDAMTPDQLVSIHFRVNENADVWIDHVEFIPVAE